MIKPEVLPRDYQAVKFATVFEAPLVVVPHISAFPATELFVAGGLTYWAKNRHPQRHWSQHAAAGVLTMLVTLGSEWAHNMAHALVAKLVGKPVDAIRVVFGMPLLVYHDLHDPSVTPRQHILRATGGPLFNLLLLPLLCVWQKRAYPGSVSRDVADAAVATNIFLPLAGLLPIPGLDGGAILKWALVDRGKRFPEADEFVRQANYFSSAGLAAGSAFAIKKRKWWLGGLLGLLGGLSFFVAKGWLKES